jgi:hypothetical protein
MFKSKKLCINKLEENSQNSIIVNFDVKNKIKNSSFIGSPSFEHINQVAMITIWRAVFITDPSCEFFSSST